MKKQILFLFSLLPIILLAQLDVKVMDADQVRSLNIPAPYVNPVGKVLISSDFDESHKNSNQVSLDPPELEGWPLLGIVNTTGRGSRFIDIDLDGEKEIIIGTGNVVRVFTPAGEVKPGWPVTLGSYGVEGAPSVGNIDDDPELEIMVHTTLSGVKGELYAIDHDGTIKPNFPIFWPDGGPQKEPLLENIDEDPELEIFSAVYNWPECYVYAHNGDGTLDEYWQEKVLDYIPGSGCSSGDLNGDGVPEIIACSFWKLYAFTIKGQLLEGFPFTFDQDIQSVSYSNPVIADIDEDGFNEIVVATCNQQPITDAGAVYVINNDGSLVDGWPQFVLRWIYAPVTVADIDQDSHLDILVGDQVLSPIPDDYMHAWDKDGNSLPGFPVAPLDAINVQGMVSDFDGDQDLEIIVDNNVTGGPFQIFNHDGSTFESFTLNPAGATFFNTVQLQDVNSDGMLNIIAPTVNFQAFSTDLHVYDLQVPYDPALLTLGTPQYNSRNSGEYGLFDPITSIPETSTDSGHLFQAFPNPFQTHIHIEGPGNLTGELIFMLYNSNGALITNKNLNSKFPERIDVPVDLPAGIYYYCIHYENGTESGKLIKQ